MTFETLIYQRGSRRRRSAPLRSPTIPIKRSVVRPVANNITNGW